MMTTFWDETGEVERFVAQMIPHCSRGFGNCVTMGVLDDNGLLMAGIVYHNWDKEAEHIEISGAALTPRWLTREVLRAMFDYPFGPLCNCQMVVMRLPVDNKRLVYLLSRYGFEFVRQRRMFGRERDGFIASLTVEDWANNKFNKQRHFAAIEEAA